jgi:protein MpaA
MRGRSAATAGTTAAALAVASVLAGCSTALSSAAPETTAPGAPPSAEAPPVDAAAPTAAVSTTVPSTAPATVSPGASPTAPAVSGPSAPARAPTSSSTVVPVGPVVCPPTGASIWDLRPPADLPAPAPPEGWTTEVIGTSVQGRDLVALVRRAEAPRRRVLVIGGLHGNEPVSPPTVRGLVAAAVDDDVELWLVPEANPDGVAAGMRCNANGVDLNRNFPWDWRADDGGPGPLSEPEPSALAALVDRLTPDLVVWVHQPYGYVSSIGPTAAALEEAWAEAAGIPVRPDVTQHGGGESWTALGAGFPSMLVEIDDWTATPATVAAHRAGFEATVDALG